MAGRRSIGWIARGKADEVWYWLLRNGPHGSSFDWAPQLNGRYDCVEHLKQIIAESTEQDAEFPVRARQAALEALGYEQPGIVRRGIQVLAIIGTEEDLNLIKKLQDHPDQAVARDARSCLFERGIKPSSAG